MVEQGKNMKKNLILIIGGFLLNIYNCAVAQNYGSWKFISSLNIPRANHSSTVLPNGNILVTGSTGSPNFLSSCEIYDTLLKTWRYTKPMKTGRSQHKAILLKNGKVLVVGGFMLRSCELFDPITETWVFTDSLITKRAFYLTVSLLNDGNVLVTGGHAYSDDFRYSMILNNCEIYNAGMGIWRTTDTLKIARTLHTATVLLDGRVLVAGGYGNNQKFLNSCEIYDPTTGEWAFVDSLNIARRGHSATLLPNGKVLVAGGRNDPYSWLRSCEVYDPQSNTWTLVDSMIFPREGHSGILVLDSLILFSGGGISSTTWELYNASSFTPLYLDLLPLYKIIHDIIQLPNDKVISIGGWTRSGIAIYPTDTCLIYEPSLTSVKIENNEAPKSFNLFQNYPNPFNATTNIKFSIAELGVRNAEYSKPNSLNQQFVTLKVYDVLGREVATLVDEVKESGTHHFPFSIIHYPLPSGVYFYQLRVGSFVETKKMILMK
jgi:N-acetylneuraminic acid mutarotase